MMSCKWPEQFNIRKFVLYSVKASRHCDYRCILKKRKKKTGGLSLSSSTRPNHAAAGFAAILHSYLVVVEALCCPSGEISRCAELHCITWSLCRMRLRSNRGRFRRSPYMRGRQSGSYEYQLVALVDRNVLTSRFSTVKMKEKPKMSTNPKTST